MNQTEREKALAILKATSDKPGGKQALRFMLNALGSIPIAGGVIAGAGSLWSERKQNETNQCIIDWASLADSDIQRLFELLGQLLSKPTYASLALLMGEIFGDKIATELLTQIPSEIPVILNSTTVSELEPYIAQQWISLHSTGSVCQMGAGNRIGNYVEELKRPYGLGNGFVLRMKIIDSSNGGM